MIDPHPLREAARRALADGRYAEALTRAHEADVFGAPRGELSLIRGLVQARRAQWAAARQALATAWAEAEDPAVLGQVAEGFRVAGDPGRAVAVALEVRGRGEPAALRYVARAPLPDAAAELGACVVLALTEPGPEPWRARAQAASAAIRGAAGRRPPPVGVLVMLAAVHAGTPLGARLLSLAWAAGLASPTVQFALLGRRLDRAPHPEEAEALALALAGQ